MPDDAVPDDAVPDDAVPDDAVPVRASAHVRRAPRYRAFALAGATVAALVAAAGVLAFGRRDDLGLALPTAMAAAAALGALVGSVVAVLLDRRSR